eukprot:g20251.t1
MKTYAVCLKHYRPIALTSIVMKCFERLIMTHINFTLPTCLNPLQFANQHNRSTKDAISLGLHSSLEHLDKDTYVRLLLIDYSSTLNTITPLTDLKTVGPWSRLCHLQLDPQLCGLWVTVRIASINKTTELIINFRKKGGEHGPIYINGTEVERVKSIKFLRVTITDNLSWTSHVDATVKMTQQRLFFFRQLRKFGMSIRSLTNFYRCTI